MLRDDELSVFNSPASRAKQQLTVIRGPCSSGDSVLYVDGALQAPIDGELRHHVRALLGRGVRIVILDMTRTSRIDAAGVSELAKVYNMAVAANSALRIEHPTTWVRDILQRVGLLDILSQG